MYVNSSDQFIYKNNGYASYYSQSGSFHEWYTSPSGTAGNVIPFTKAMTLDLNGDLVLGYGNIIVNTLSSETGNAISIFGASNTNYIQLVGRDTVNTNRVS